MSIEKIFLYTFYSTPRKEQEAQNPLPLNHTQYNYKITVQRKA